MITTLLSISKWLIINFITAILMVLFKPDIITTNKKDTPLIIKVIGAFLILLLFSAPTFILM